MTRGPIGRVLGMVFGLLLGALVLAGCGVGLQDTAEPLPSGALRPVAPAPSQTTTTRDMAVCFVNGPKLERVSEPITSRTAESIMVALAAGPPVDSGSDLRTLLLNPLNSEPVLELAKITSDGAVVLRHTEGYLQLTANDQVLLIGQVACSMNELGLTQILLVDPMGQPAPLPLPDGRAREGAATVDDYRSLIPDE